MKKNKKCKQCKVIKGLNDFPKHPQMFDGRLNKCKKCRKLNNKLYRKKNKVKIANTNKRYAKQHRKERTRDQIKYRQTFKGKYCTLRTTAKRRGLPINITLEEFILLVDQICYYCGEPNKTKGLDRIDNGKGYIKGNVVSCCFWCNNWKSNRKMKDFVEHCQKIVNKHPCG